MFGKLQLSSAPWDTPSGVCEGPSSLRVRELGVEQVCGPSPREALDAAGAWAASRTSRAWAAPVSCLVRFSLLHEVSDSPFSPPTLFFFFFFYCFLFGSSIGTLWGKYVSQFSLKGKI